MNHARCWNVSFQLLIGLLLVLALVPATQAAEEPSGYRLDNYKAEVPETLSGATRVTALQVADLQQEHNALVIDVIPAPIKPESLPEGQMWFPVKHSGIAGALWLPDVGYGGLSRILLSQQLLDVVECCQTCFVIRLFASLLVCRWYRRLDG